MVSPKKKASETPKLPEEGDAASRRDQFSWKGNDRGLVLTLGLGKGIADRLQAALDSEGRIRDVGPNELFASFLYHGLVHFEREFPLREQRAKAKKDGRTWVPPTPQGRLEGIKDRLDNIERWLVRVKAVDEALSKGDLEPARALARESIAKNTKLLEAARTAWINAAKAVSGAEGKRPK